MTFKRPDESSKLMATAPRVGVGVDFYGHHDHVLLALAAPDQTDGHEKRND
jgi:hypothetical protein